jgi:GNAT superfamily N-acetyltransferase
VRSHVDGADADGIAFAAHHGFVEVDRQVELVRTLADALPAPDPGGGIELVGSDSAELDALRPLLVEGAEDMPVVGGLGDGVADELLGELRRAAFTVTAWESGRLVGVAGLSRYGSRDDALEHAFTTVARTHRGRGIATALKHECIRWATIAGYRELVTWTQAGNDAMQAVNTAAGFRPRHVSLTVERAL